MTQCITVTEEVIVYRYHIDNIVIEIVNCNTFLRVVIVSKLSWSDHVSYSQNVEESVGDA